LPMSGASAAACPAPIPMNVTLKNTCAQARRERGAHEGCKVCVKEV
jgi:hypothetical protein